MKYVLYTASASLLAPLLLANPAQDSPDPTGPAAGVKFGQPIDQLAFSEENQSIWVRGASYKAQAHAEGFAFIPFLGSDAPKNYPLQMRLESAKLGGTPIPLTETASVSRNGQRIILDRGAVEALYDVELDGVEQTFRLDAAGSNQDLEITLEVQSELIGRAIETGLAYENELGGVHIEHAVVIDGAGQRLAIPISANDQNIQLRVPAHFLAQATNPILVDPWISSVPLTDPNGISNFSPDVAYNESGTRFAFAYTSQFSATDHDVRVETYGVNLDYVESAWIDFTGANWVEPAVASNRPGSTFLVAAERNFSGQTETEIVGRTLSATNFANISPKFTIGDAIADTTNFSVDIGGKSQGSPSYMVVWQRRFPTLGVDGIRSRFITPAVPHTGGAVPTMAPIEAVTLSQAESYQNPSISKSSGRASHAEWRVVYTGQDVFTNDVTVYSSRYTDTNGLNAQQVPIISLGNAGLPKHLDVSDGLVDLGGPVAGQPVYCLALQTATNSVLLYGIEGDNVFETKKLSEILHLAPNHIHAHPSVGTTADRFVVAYGSNTLDFGIGMSTIDLTNTGSFAVSERNSINTGISGSPSQASRYSGGNYNSRISAIGYSQLATLSSSESLGATFIADTEPSPAHQYCQGFPNSTGRYGFIRMEGSTTQSGTRKLIAEGMPQGQFGYFITGQGGFGTTTIPGSAGLHCMIGGALGRYNQGNELFFTNTTGTGELNINGFSLRGTNGNQNTVVGETWNFQAWHRESGGSSNFTNAISWVIE